LDGASAVDLVIALYDGIVRFLYEAMRAVDRGDADGRRIAVKRALDIIIHLQARLRMDVGERLQSRSANFTPQSLRKFAGFAVGVECALFARDRLREECARGMAAGGARLRREHGCDAF